jgi:hypothetical protein
MPPRSPLLALVSHGVTATLERLDPLTLTAVRGPKLFVGLHDTPATFSPDRSRIALGSGRTTTLELVQVRRLRKLALIDLPGIPAALSWPTSARLLAIVSEPDRFEALLVDTRSHRVIARHSIARTMVISTIAMTRTSVVLVLAPRQKLGPAMLAVVGNDGRARTIRLPKIVAGSASRVGTSWPPLVRVSNPGLTTDPGGNTAYIAASDGTITEIDLRSLTVQQRSLSVHRTLFARLRAWLYPQARADGGIAVGWRRQLIWLRPGLLAVSGERDYAARVGKKKPQPASVPGGLSLINTRHWALSKIDRKVGLLTRTPTGFVAYEGSLLSRLTGLAVFGRDGRRRFVLPLREGAGQVAHNRLYLGLENEYRRQRATIVDLASGAVHHTWAPGWVLLLDPAAPPSCWC